MSSSLVVRRTTSVSKSGAGTHNCANHRKVVHIFVRLLCASLEAGDSGRELKRNGKVPSSTIFE